MLNFIAETLFIVALAAAAGVVLDQLFRRGRS
jgi:hypothetical protein